MFVIIPHVGKSHLTYRTVRSIPDEHRIVVVDGSFLRDLNELARCRRKQMVYVPTDGTPYCLAHNWNLGTSHVPDEEEFWLYCASDIEFTQTSFKRILDLEKLYPDAAIIKDKPTNWNVWLIRRWAWDLLGPYDTRYKPCGGEDDDLVMKCFHAGLKIREGYFMVTHMEGGHAARLDIGDEFRGTDWKARHHNINVFREKWGCKPSKAKDPVYRKAILSTHIRGQREKPPGDFTPPTERIEYPKQHPPAQWPDPLRLHFGSGLKPLEGFVNIDLPSCGKARGCDYRMDVIRDPWPWQPGSVERIESYHFMEHCTEEEGLAIMQNAFRVLKPGGVFVAETPDMEAMCAAYPRSRRKMRWGIFGKPAWGPGMGHRWGYCGPTFELVLGKIGFVNIKTGVGTDYHQTKGICPCVRVEATKP